MFSNWLYCLTLKIGGLSCQLASEVFFYCFCLSSREAHLVLVTFAHRFLIYIGQVEKDQCDLETILQL